MDFTKKNPAQLSCTFRNGLTSHIKKNGYLQITNLLDEKIGPGKNRSSDLYDTVQYTFYARKYKVLTNYRKSYHKRWIDPSVKETLKYLKF